MTEELRNRPAPASETGSLARRLAANYVQMVEFYKDRMELPPDEAHGRVRDLVSYDTERILDAPPDQVSWFALQRVLEHDPERGYAAWERIKAEAREDLASGHRAAASLDRNGGPWGRAQFLAIRDAFRAEWQPRGGIEDALIDALAQTHANYLYWVEQLHILATTEGQLQDHRRKKDGYWQPPRVEVNDWIEQAATMTDRFNRLFLRTLRGLRDLRRYAPPVVIQNAGQVNVSGGHQQVNVTR